MAWPFDPWTVFGRGCRYPLAFSSWGRHTCRCHSDVCGSASCLEVQPVSVKPVDHIYIFDNRGCGDLKVNVRFLTIGICFFAETIWNNCQPTLTWAVSCNAFAQCIIVPWRWSWCWSMVLLVVARIHIPQNVKSSGARSRARTSAPLSYISEARILIGP